MVRFQTRPARQGRPPPASCTVLEMPGDPFPGPDDSCIDILRKSLQQPRTLPGLGAWCRERNGGVSSRTVGSSQGRAVWPGRLPPAASAPLSQEDQPGAHGCPLLPEAAQQGREHRFLKIPRSLRA